MKLVLASKNTHKIEELKAILNRTLPFEADLLSLSDIGFEGEIEETGTTFEENALLKAKAVAALGYVGIGDDSGLAVEALDGAPGIFSARYAGEHGNDAKNNAKLLADLQGIDNRRAAFVCTMACAFPAAMGGESFVVRGECPGEILRESQGKAGFGYDPLFFLPPFGKTFAEMRAEEKNAVSHRGKAAEALAERLASCRVLTNG